MIKRNISLKLTSTFLIAGLQVIGLSSPTFSQTSSPECLLESTTLGFDLKGLQPAPGSEEEERMLLREKILEEFFPVIDETKKNQGYVISETNGFNGELMLAKLYYYSSTGILTQPKAPSECHTQANLDQYKLLNGEYVQKYKDALDAQGVGFEDTSNFGLQGPPQ